MIARRTKSLLARSLREQKGQAFILVIIFMFIGFVVITPLLSMMSTGLNSGLVFQKRATELYSANAGVSAAIWNLKNGTQTPLQGETVNLDLTGLPVNDKTQIVKVFCQSKNKSGGTYRITSTATTPGGTATTIETWVDTNPFFFDYAAISTATVEGKNTASIYGPVAGDTSGFKGDIYGRISDPWDPTVWPFSIFRDYYKTPEVLATSLAASIGTAEAGPGIRHGNLEFNPDDGYLKLTGTIYVEGDLELSKNKDFILDLNKQTIYVEGSIDSAPSRPTIVGSGCIIAEGNVRFWPRMESTPDDFVFVVSLNDEVYFLPGGDFYGSLAGKLNINLQPNNTLTRTDPPPDLNFPDPTQGVEAAVHTRTWNIIPPFKAATIPLKLVTSSLPEGEVGVDYLNTDSTPVTPVTLEATGGTPDYTWSITVGALPDGLDLDADTGEISGEPTTAGTFDFTVRVTDNASPTHATDSKTLSITVNGGLSVTTTSLPDGFLYKAYAGKLEALNGTLPYTWSLQSGTLPGWATLNTTTGEITGTPTNNPGDVKTTSGLVFRVTDHVTTTAISPSLSIKVNAGLTVTSTSLPDGYVGDVYTGKLTAGGGTLPYTWSLQSGTLPGWATLNTTTGEITGTPGSGATGTTLGLVFKVTDNTTPTKATALSVTMSITIGAGPEFTWAQVTDGGAYITVDHSGFIHEKTIIVTINNKDFPEGVTGKVNLTFSNSTSVARIVTYQLTTTAPADYIITLTGAVSLTIPATGTHNQNVSIAKTDKNNANATYTVTLTFSAPPAP